MPMLMRALIAILVLWAAPSTVWAFGPDRPAVDARLIGPVGGGGAGQYVFGLALGIPPGWHSYWRTPGDVGMRPVADFSASRNLAGANLLFPPPTRLDEAGMTSLIYRGRIVLPIRVLAGDAGAPGVLAVHFAYGLCREICVPLALDLQKPFAPALSADPADSAVLAAALGLLPQAETPSGPLHLSALQVRSPGLAEISVASDVAGRPDLFVEGPDGWSLAQPEPDVASAASPWRFRLSLDGAPKGAVLAGTALRFTVVTPAGSIEAMRRMP